MISSWAFIMKRWFKGIRSGLVDYRGTQHFKTGTAQSWGLNSRVEQLGRIRCSRFSGYRSDRICRILRAEVAGTVCLTTIPSEPYYPSEALTSSVNNLVYLSWSREHHQDHTRKSKQHLRSSPYPTNHFVGGH